MSRWVILKFGGTSVSSRARWNIIERIVRARIDDGFAPVVVCSALSEISNLLERLLEDAVGEKYDETLQTIRARHLEIAADLDIDGTALLEEDFAELKRLALGASLTREAGPRLHARVLALGELMSTKLGAAFLASRGLEAVWRDARDMLRADENRLLPERRQYLSAACLFDPDAKLQADLARLGGDLVITQGFIVSNKAGETALLGRGGSDTSASCLGAALGAERIEIWTDVPGMFTANPRDIPSARLLRQLDYAEAQELATMGAKVLHPRSIEPAWRQRIPIHIKCTSAPDLPGTVISNDISDGGAQIKAIATKAAVTLISMESTGMWQEVGFLADVFATFREHGLSIDLVATSETNVTVSLDQSANALEAGRIDALLEALNAYCNARQIGPCAIVSLIGRNIRSILHEMGPAFEVFHEQQVHQVSQAAGDLNFSFVVDEEQAARLTRKLHAQFFGKRAPDALIGPDWRELMEKSGEEPPSRAAWWQNRREDLLAIASETSPVYVYDENTLRESLARVLSIGALDRVFYSVKANGHPDILRLFHDGGIGFECVSPDEIRFLIDLFPDIDRRRILFTPNFAPREEYAEGYDLGAYVTLDNIYPLEAWPDVFRGRELLVRMDPGQGRGHHKYVQTAGSQSKFGVAAAELERLAELAAEADARVVGFHAHVGSGIVAPDTWAETAVFLASLRDRFPDVRILDVGGGLPVSERRNAPEPDMIDIAETLDAFKKAHPDLELWMEPGRFLVARAGVLLARVTQTKWKGATGYVGVETGMNSLIRPALYGAWHEIVNLSRLDEPSTIAADVVGPICETGDVLGYGRRLPTTREGDVMLIATAGAYGRVMSNTYNMRQPAEEVVLRG